MRNKRQFFHEKIITPISEPETKIFVSPGASLGIDILNQQNTSDFNGLSKSTENVKKTRYIASKFGNIP